MDAKTFSSTPSSTFVDPELGEGTPLLLASADGGDEQPLEDIKDWTRRERAVAGISAISFGSSVGAMMLSPTPIVLTAGTIGALLAPYVAFQQQKITDVQALSETNMRAQEEVQQLQQENGKLQAHVTDLTESVHNLKLQKQKLDTIASSQGTSISELETQLNETREIYGKLQTNLQGDVLNNLVEIALACDENADMSLSDGEIDATIKKLESINGLDLDNDGIRKVIVQNGRSFDSIMDLIRNLLKSDLTLEQSLFKEAKKVAS